MDTGNIYIVVNEERIAKAFEAAGFQTLCADVKDLIGTKNSRQRTFVSPGNSLGFMDGGIDQAYMDMFPGIVKRVKKAYAKADTFNVIGQPFLPIGAAVHVEMEDDKKNAFIAAPTMWLPQDVSKTNNAYHATKAVMHIWEGADDPERLLMLPAMCCGFGKMKWEESATQMKRAILDANAEKASTKGVLSLPFGVDTIRTLNLIANDQPYKYFNRDFVGSAFGITLFPTPPQLGGRLRRRKYEFNQFPIGYNENENIRKTQFKDKECRNIKP